jgi:hypothetical protein
VVTPATRARSLRRTTLAWLITFAPALCHVAGCGSLLGISDLPGLDGGDGAAAHSEDGSSSSGSSSGSADVGSASEEASESGSENSDGGGSSSGGDDGGSGTCTPGATQCTSDTQVETCNTSGQWGAATTCSFVCTGYMGGNCGGVCTPNTTQCTSDTQVETCSASGQWGTATTCTYACVGADGGVAGDDGGAGGNCGGVCVPGATQCNNNPPAEAVETCASNGTLVSVACPVGELCFSNVGSPECLNPNQ